MGCVIFHLNSVMMLLFVLFWSTVDAMKGSFTIPRVDPWEFNAYLRFGFLSGGDIVLQRVTVANHPDPTAFMWAMACTSSQVEQLLSFDSAEELCRYNISHICLSASAFGPLLNSTDWVQQNVPVSSTGYLTFLYLSCARSSNLALQIDYNLLNPNGEALSSGDIPTKALSLMYIWLWIAAAVLLVAHLVWVRSKYQEPLEWSSFDTSQEPQLASPIRPVHYWLLAPTVLFAVAAAVTHELYQQTSETGVIPQVLNVADALMWQTACASTISLLLALSRGWQLTRLRLHPREWRQIAVLITGYIIAWCLWSQLSGFVFLFTLVLLYTLILRYLFASVTWSLRLLQMFRLYTAGMSAAYGGAQAAQGATQPLIAPATSQEGRSGGTADSDAPASPRRNGDGVELQPMRSPQVQEEVNPAYAAALAASVASGSGRSGAYGSTSVTATAASTAGATRGSTTRSSSGGSTWAATARARMYSLARSATGATQYAPVPSHGDEDTAGGRRVGSGLYDGGLTSRQLKVLRFFRTTVIIFLGLDVFLQVWAGMELDDVPWVSYLLQRMLFLLMFGLLVWTFRARTDPQQSVLYDPRGYVGSPLEQLLTNSADGTGTATGAAAGSTQSPSAPAPAPRVIIINPDTVDDSGKIVHPLALAER